MASTWRIVVADQPGLLLANIIACQEAWSRLRKPSRAALLALSADTSTPINTNIRRALVEHGLLDPDTGALTDGGHAVVRHRPVSTVMPSHLCGRPVINVHLPEGIPA